MFQKKTLKRWKEDNDIAEQMLKEAGVQMLVFRKKLVKLKNDGIL